MDEGSTKNTKSTKKDGVIFGEWSSRAKSLRRKGGGAQSFDYGMKIEIFNIWVVDMRVMRGLEISSYKRGRKVD